MRAAKIHAIICIMDINIALRIVYAIFALSIAALIAVLGSYFLHYAIPAPYDKPLMMLGYIWPAAAYGIAYLRKRRVES